MRIKEKARAINAYSQRSSLTANKNLFLKRKCHELNLASLRGGYKDESGKPLTPSQTLSICLLYGKAVKLSNDFRIERL